MISLMLRILIIELIFQSTGFADGDSNSLCDANIKAHGRIENDTLVFIQLSQKCPEIDRNNKLLESRLIQLTLHDATVVPVNIFENCTNLEILSFLDNQITEISNVYLPDPLKSIKLDNNKINIPIDNNLFKNIKKGNIIDYVTLNSCDIKELYDETFYNLEKLATLELINNNLTFLPEKLLVNNKLLFSIDLSNNFLTQLPNNLFCNNLGLGDVAMKNNSLQIIHKEMFCNVETNLTFIVSNKTDYENQLHCYNSSCQWENTNFVNVTLITKPFNITSNETGEIFCSKFIVVEKKIEIAYNKTKIAIAGVNFDPNVAYDSSEYILYAWLYVAFVIFIQIIILSVLLGIYFRDKNKVE